SNLRKFARNLDDWRWWRWWSLLSGEEVVDRSPKGCGQANQIGSPRLCIVALDLADRALAQPCLLSKLVLGPPTLLPNLSHPLAKSLDAWDWLSGRRHVVSAKSNLRPEATLLVRDAQWLFVASSFGSTSTA